MTQPILVRVPGIAVTEANLKGLAERSIRHRHVSDEQAMGAILAHVEEMVTQAQRLQDGLTGRLTLVVHEDLSVGWRT